MAGYIGAFGYDTRHPYPGGVRLVVSIPSLKKHEQDEPFVKRDGTGTSRY